MTPDLVCLVRKSRRHRCRCRRRRRRRRRRYDDGSKKGWSHQKDPIFVFFREEVPKPGSAPTSPAAADAAAEVLVRESAGLADRLLSPLSFIC